MTLALVVIDGSSPGPSSTHVALCHLQKEGKDFVLLDVRNYFEYDIGHFDGAIHPEMKAFSQYPQYIEKHLDQFENKPVMMYCTGGIRCEKASAFLKAKGVDEVYQLKGGIHRYLEQFPDGGLWAGKNFVFDKRVAMAPEEQPKDRAVVGTCLECAVPYDELSGDRVCTVCRGPVLICPACNDKLWELHCTTHQHLKRCYFTDLSPFSAEELKAQRKELQVLHTELLQAGKKAKNKRRTLMKQIERLGKAMEAKAREGTEGKETDTVREQEKEPLQEYGSKRSRSESTEARKRCRTCAKEDCSGNCWGFWAKEKPIDRLGWMEQ